MWQVFRYSDCRIITAFADESSVKRFIAELPEVEQNDYGWKLRTMSEITDSLLVDWSFDNGAY